MKTAFRTDARVLRRRGHSLGELSDRFGISKSTASLWTKDVIPSQLGIERVQTRKERSVSIGHAVLHEAKLRRMALAESSADTLLKSIDKDDRTIMLVALATMYWCEGNKSDRCVSFTNSDHRLARAFVKMLKSIFAINPSKLKVCIHIHDYHDERQILEFWSSALGIPISQFTRPYRKESNHLYEKSEYKGCARITYYDSHIARVLLSFAKKFIKLYIY